MNVHRDDIDILSEYHENTKNLPWTRRNRKASQIHYEKPILELMAMGPKTYENRSRMKLPEIKRKKKIDGSFESVARRRRSSRDFSQQPMSMMELAKILFFANGISESYKYEGYLNYKRNVPSSGNLGSVEIYPFIANVMGVEAGIYHYNPLHHELYCLRHGNFKKALAERMLYQSEFAEAAVVLALSALIGRVRIKYGGRAYRLVHLDAGHIGQNIYLCCSALGMACCSTAGFIEDEVNSFIEIDGLEESVVYMLAVGHRELE